MYQAHEVLSAADRDLYANVPDFVLPPRVLERQRPDALWMLLDRQETVAARCALWWRETPSLEAQRLGLVGHYVARESAAASQLLARASRVLADQGCTLAVGPMDGNTWQRYRLVTERGDEPPFFLEPDNPDDWPGHFTASGYRPLAHYFSAVATNLSVEEPRLAVAARDLEARGVQFRTLQPQRFVEELHQLYTLSLHAFQGNFLYTPIREPDFQEQYQTLESWIEPELVLLAEKHNQLVGFLFALPDLLEKQREGQGRTVIAKTMAVHPDFRGAGLGGLLMARTHQAARKLGYTRVIHALMHQTNHSRNLSAHTARIFRRYTLYARSLENLA